MSCYLSVSVMTSLALSPSGTYCFSLAVPHGNLCSAVDCLVSVLLFPAP